MAALLNEIYDNFVNELLETGENKISYNEWWKEVEYTEWYAFRDSGFREKILGIIEKPYFKRVFLIVLSSLFSSSNEEQFLDVLDRYLSAFLSKKLLKEGEDLYEKKTYIRAYLGFTEDHYLKNKLILEGWDWKKYDNAPLMLKGNKSIFTIVEHIYEKIENDIFNNPEV